MQIDDQLPSALAELVSEVLDYRDIPHEIGITENSLILNTFDQVVDAGFVELVVVIGKRCGLRIFWINNIEGEILRLH